MSTARIRAVGASKRFGAHTALEDVSIELHGGRLTGLIGANGAGKTTLIRAMTGLIALDSGRVDTSAPREAVGYLPEERGLYPRQTPLRTLTYLGELRGLPPDAARREAEWWLARVALPDAGRRRLESFSKGQQQTAQLASAFLGRPPLIVLDEPFSGLDPLNVQLVRSLIEDARAWDAAILLSAHQLHLVEEWCDDVVMLARGRVVLNEDIADVRDAGHDLQRVFLDRAVAKGGGL